LISDAIELGYHIGNLGWRVRFEGDVLFVAMQGRAENYVVRLGELIWSRRVGISVVWRLDSSRIDQGDRHKQEGEWGAEERRHPDLD
jgi:urease accessory protein